MRRNARYVYGKRIYPNGGAFFGDYGDALRKSGV